MNHKYDLRGMTNPMMRLSLHTHVKEFIDQWHQEKYEKVDMDFSMTIRKFHERANTYHHMFLGIGEIYEEECKAIEVYLRIYHKEYHELFYQWWLSKKVFLEIGT